MLFGERGFDAVTVREICSAARANVAAVNYHFGDKLGLYGEVVEVAIAAMRHAALSAAGAAEEGPPEARLRTYVLVFLERLTGRGREAWVHHLLSREFEAPTPALDRILDRVFRPRIARLSAIVAELLRCSTSDARVGRTVASIQGQCLLYRQHALVSRLMPRFQATPEKLEELADHITRFSLGGIAALAEPAGK
jgi:AcrR family transcriptional regulator